MCADICIHDKQNGNPHAHILLTTRPVDCNGFGKKKERDWDKRVNVSIWREQWAEAQNAAYKRVGLKESVSHESYIKRGINLEPTKHLGPRVTALERRGIQTERGKQIREIKERNEEDRENKRSLSREPNGTYEREQTFIRSI